MVSPIATVAVGCVAGVSMGLLGAAVASPVPHSSSKGAVVTVQQSPGGGQQGGQQGDSQKQKQKERMMRKIMPLLKDLSKATTDEEKLVIANDMIEVMKKKSAPSPEPSESTKPSPKPKPSDGGGISQEQQQQWQAAMVETKTAYRTFHDLKESYTGNPSQWTDEQKAALKEAIVQIQEAVAALEALAESFGIPMPKLPPIPPLPEGW